MNHELVGLRQACAAQQENASRVGRNLTGDSMLLRRAIRGPQLRSRPEQMFIVLQGTHLESFRALPACVGLYACRRPYL